jgi:hypothetical protein
MRRMIFAGIAAVAIGTIGGIALAPAKSANETALPAQTATVASPVVAKGQKPVDPAPAVAPKRIAEMAPPPAPKVPPAPAPTVQATPDKPEIRFDGDRVSVRFGNFKIEF